PALRPAPGRPAPQARSSARSSGPLLRPASSGPLLRPAPQAPRSSGPLLGPLL
ncbi:hypothetical protein NHX12_016289, partial [Muraenolepis orangiensis]